MNLSERDKKVVVVGGIAAAAIVVFGYVVMPLVRTVSGSNAALSSKAAYVADLRERLDSQGSLVKQRNALARRLGSLFEAPDKPEPKKAKKGAGAATPESPKPETKPQEAQTPTGPVTPESPKAVPATPESPKAAAAETPESPKAASAETPESPKAASAETPESPKAASAETPESPKAAEAKGHGDKKDEKKPDAPTGATLAAYVEQSAKKAEATVKSITPLKTTAGMRSTKYYRPVMLQVKVQCKAKGLLALLQALENGERFVKVEQLQIHREPSKDDIDVTLDVRAYESAGRVS
jgi:hypothetical protein